MLTILVVNYVCKNKNEAHNIQSEYQNTEIFIHLTESNRTFKKS